MALTVALLSRRGGSPASGDRDALSHQLTCQLGLEVRVVDGTAAADLVWLDTADPEDVGAVRSAHPGTGLLVTLDRGCGPDAVVRAFALGADLVQRDEGLALAGAGLAALARRTRPDAAPRATAC